MIGPLTLDEAVAMFRANVDARWYAEFTSTPDGLAIVHACVAPLVEADLVSYEAARSLLLRYATRAKRATAELSIKRTRPGPPLNVPAGTRVQSPDGVVFLTDASVTIREGEVGVDKFVSATAELPGHAGVFPAGTIDRFSTVLEGLSGQGTEVAVSVSGGSRRVRLVTDTTVPHPFVSSLLGLYVTITTAELAHAANVGKVVQAANVNSGLPTDPTLLEGTTLWSSLFVAGSPEVVGWSTGAQEFEWRVCQWAELGLTVVNRTDATRGASGALDARANERGISPSASEGDEVLRARLQQEPQLPSPLGLLRHAVGAVGPWGQGLAEIAVYESGALPSDATEDSYAANFPAAVGFLADLHVADLVGPVTPDEMASFAPDYSTIPNAKNPGLALPLDSVTSFLLVAWLPEGTFDEAAARPVRISIYDAIQRAKAPGVEVGLYYPPLWGFP